MKTTIKEFIRLKETMEKYGIFVVGDEVSDDLNALEIKLAEIERRLLMIDFVATDINDAISNFTQRVDKGLLIKLSVDVHDLIRTGSDDLKILSDLDDTMPIEDYWYNLFGDNLITMEQAIDKNNKKRESRVVKNEDIIDGETLQSYVEKLGMSEQILRQLFLRSDTELINNLLEELEELMSQKKKQEIERVLINLFTRIPIDTPDNINEIVQFCYEDVCETADKNDWCDGDVAIAFRRWIEQS